HGVLTSSGKNDRGEKLIVKTFLFACTHNAGRSQMAAALFNLYADRSGCLAISAGTEPADHIHPEVVEVMREVSIDVSSAKPRRLTDDLARTASVSRDNGVPRGLSVRSGLADG